MSEPESIGALLRRSVIAPVALEDRGRALPSGILRLVLATSARHQALLCVLTVVVFLIEIVPLELQRRIVNGLVEQSELSLVPTSQVDFGAIVLLCAVYAGVAVLHGGLKLLLNIYRNWVGERITLQLRTRINGSLAERARARGGAAPDGIPVALIVSEVEPVGAFVGHSVTEPLLQAGILVTVVAYMVTLQPTLAAVVLAVLVPQVLAVTFMQRAINRRVSQRVRTLRAVSSDVVSPNRGGSPDARTGERLAEVFELNMGIFKLRFGLLFLMNLIQHLAVIATLLFGGALVINGEVGVGLVVAFVSAVGRLRDPWGDLVHYFRELSQIQTRYALLVRAMVGLDAVPRPDGSTQSAAE